MAKQRYCRRLLIDSAGSAMIEFALVLPIILLISLPITDFFLFSMQKQKVNRAAMTYADMITLSLPVTNDVDDDEINTNLSYLTLQRLRDMLVIFDPMMQPFTSNDSVAEDSTDHIIITSVYQPVPTAVEPNPQPVVMWQYWHSRDGSREYFSTAAPQDIRVMPDDSEASAFGDVGQPANVPPEFVGNMYPGENFVTVEVRTYYEAVLPGISPFVGGELISSTKLFPARYGALCRLAKNPGGGQPFGCP